MRQIQSSSSSPVRRNEARTHSERLRLTEGKGITCMQGEGRSRIASGSLVVDKLGELLHPLLQALLAPASPEAGAHPIDLAAVRLQATFEEFCARCEEDLVFFQQDSKQLHRWDLELLEVDPDEHGTIRLYERNFHLSEGSLDDRRVCSHRVPALRHVGVHELGIPQHVGQHHLRDIGERMQNVEGLHGVQQWLMRNVGDTSSGTRRPEIFRQSPNSDVRELHQRKERPPTSILSLFVPAARTVDLVRDQVDAILSAPANQAHQLVLAVRNASRIFGVAHNESANRRFPSESGVQLSFIGQSAGVSRVGLHWIHASQTFEVHSEAGVARASIHHLGLHSLFGDREPSFVREKGCQTCKAALRCGFCRLFRGQQHSVRENSGKHADGRSAAVGNDEQVRIHLHSILEDVLLQNIGKCLSEFWHA
mmetsp:Transcript_93559/g.195039  ORF Transcript_93559/g.195039 Transcript_93559/m.195039 type:complete len:423 (-) Transcript_93559:453-1721(-)